MPQSAYECAAPLKITPTPDVVTRVFMLFKGVRDEDSVLWPEAKTRAKDDPSIWARIIGVDFEKTVDTGLYRVIEWGGMEVLAT